MKRIFVNKEDMVVEVLIPGVSNYQVNYKDNRLYVSIPSSRFMEGISFDVPFPIGDAKVSYSACMGVLVIRKKE